MFGAPPEADAPPSHVDYNRLHGRLGKSPLRGDGRVRACHGIEAEGEAPERRWAHELHLPQQGRTAEGRR